jgi:hypothetical protein
MNPIGSVAQYAAGDEVEVIWVWELGASDPVPANFALLGYEPTWFPSFFSAVCDSMFLPRWHGADREGSALSEHFKRLNAHGLFNSHAEATAFLTHYLSFDWAEQPISDTPGEAGSYVTVEVYTRP